MRSKFRLRRQKQERQSFMVFLAVLSLFFTLIMTGCDGNSDNDSPTSAGDSTCTHVPLPTATIIVDGDPGDWTGIAAALTDPQGDDSPDYTGDDIQALYIAKDAEQIYFRLDLWENANQSFGNGPAPDDGRYEIHVQGDTTAHYLEFGIAYDVREWSLGGNGSNSSNTPPELQGPEFVGVRNNVIELRIPLVSLGNPLTFPLIRGRIRNCCATDPILTLDVTDCVSAEM